MLVVGMSYDRLASHLAVSRTTICRRLERISEKMAGDRVTQALSWAAVRAKAPRQADAACRHEGELTFRTYLDGRKTVEMPEEIYRGVGRSKISQICKSRERGRKRRFVAQQVKKAVADLLQQGLSLRAISGKVGVAYTRVRTIKNELAQPRARV